MSIGAKRRIYTNRSESVEVSHSQVTSNTDKVRIQNIKETKSAGLQPQEIKKIENIKIDTTAHTKINKTATTNIGTPGTTKTKASEAKFQDEITKGMTFKGYRMDEVGRKMEKEGAKAFYDIECYGMHRKVRVFAVKVWYDDNVIAGIQAGYRSETGQLVQGSESVLNKEKYKSILWKCDLTEDYLKNITGFMNKEETAIESLTLVSNKGETRTVGTPKKDSKPFKYDINDLEYPAVFHGSYISIEILIN